MASYHSRMGHGYRSAAEIRKTKIVNLLFALIATAAIGLQIYMLSDYFTARSQKNKTAADYAAAERLLSDSDKEVLNSKSEYNALAEDVASLEIQLDELNAEE